MHYNRLIVANEVLEVAFNRNDQIDITIITDSKVESAELRFLAPALGELYYALIEGKHPEFTANFVKAPLAYYIKYILIPELSIKIGNIGVVKNKNPDSNTASEKDIDVIRAEAKKMANTLLKRAIRYLEENLENFPEYDPEKNVSKKTSIYGGVIV